MIDPRTPVLVGVGAVMDREDDPTRCDEASELMVRAARAAIADSGAPSLRSRIGAVGAMASMTRYRDPARLVVDGLALDDGVLRLRADPGTLQQRVFNWACELIASGMDAVLVVSGEAKYRELRAAIMGVDVPVTRQREDERADLTWSVGSEILSAPEFEHQMFDAVQHYAMLEFAWARHRGVPLGDHMAGVAELMSRQSAASVDNEDAWHREFFPPNRIAEIGPANRMVSWPYAKWHNSQWNVNQGAALLFCSAEAAEAAAVSKDRWVFPRGGAVSNFMQPITNRPELHRARWARASATSALELAELPLDDVDPMELYSCFPVAVEMQAAEMGIDLDARAATITGGMTFAGGPLNSWVLHAVVAMAQRLRSSAENHGLVTSVSGMMTKHGTGVWSSEPGSGGLRVADVTAEMERLPARPIIEGHIGEAELVAATVVHDRDGPVRALAMAEVRGSRLLAASSDSDVIAALMSEPDSVSVITVGQQGFTL